MNLGALNKVDSSFQKDLVKIDVGLNFPGFP